MKQVNKIWILLLIVISTSSVRKVHSPNLRSLVIVLEEITAHFTVVHVQAKAHLL